MPPKIRFQKQQIVDAAMNIARTRGIDAVTAREVARELSVSVGPIFTWFETMEQLRVEVYERAKDCYRAYMEKGLAEPIPFQGLGRQYIRFAKEEPEQPLRQLHRAGLVPQQDDRAGGGRGARAEDP